MAVQYQIGGTNAAEISASVESGVRSGALPPATPLPPVRRLAADLGLSPATVASAYQQLRRRGVVETAGRHGTRVRRRPPVAGPRAARRLAVPPGVRDLSAGGPDRRLLPDLRPHLARLAGELTIAAGYGEAGTLPELAEAAADRLASEGVPAGPVIVTSGALDGIERLLAANLRPGDRVAVEDPGWSNLLDLVAALGLEPVAVPVDGEGPTVPGLRRALAAGAGGVIVTARAQNPTGAAVTAERAGALRDLFAAHPRTMLIEDDHSAELSTVALHALAGSTGRWAFVRSMSKPYGPDLRLAVVTGDEATVARVEGRLRAGAGWVSTVLQRLVAALWRDEQASAGVVRARESYRRRRTALREELSARGVAAYGHTGINVWVPVPDETRAVAVLRDAGYAVAPGALYRLDSGPGVRITVSPLDGADLVPLAEAVARAVVVPDRVAHSA